MRKTNNETDSYYMHTFDIYSQLIFRKHYYTMCLEDDRNHVHDVCPILIGSIVEKSIFQTLLALFRNNHERFVVERLRNLFLSYEAVRKRQILTGCIITSTLNYAMFREYKLKKYVILRLQKTNVYFIYTILRIIEDTNSIFLTIPLIN